MAEEYENLDAMLERVRQVTEDGQEKPPDPESPSKTPHRDPPERGEENNS